MSAPCTPGIQWYTLTTLHISCSTCSSAWRRERQSVGLLSVQHSSLKQDILRPDSCTRVRFTVCGDALTLCIKLYWTSRPASSSPICTIYTLNILSFKAESLAHHNLSLSHTAAELFQSGVQQSIQMDQSQEITCYSSSSSSHTHAH